MAYQKWKRWKVSFFPNLLRTYSAAFSFLSLSHLLTSSLPTGASFFLLSPYFVFETRKKIGNDDENREKKKTTTANHHNSPSTKSNSRLDQNNDRQSMSNQPTQKIISKSNTHVKRRHFEKTSDENVKKIVN